MPADEDLKLKVKVDLLLVRLCPSPKSKAPLVVPGIINA